MEKPLIPILFLESSLDVGGQELRMLDTVRRLDRARFQPFIGARAKSRLWRDHRAGVDMRCFSMRNAVDFVGLAQITRFMLRARIQVVVTYSGKDAWLGLMAARLTGARVARMKNLALFKRPWSYNRVDQVIVPSQFMRDFLAQRGVREDRMTVIPPGVDFADFAGLENHRAATRAEFAVQDGEILLAYAAYFRQPKGHRTLLAAMARIRDLPIKLLLIGDGQDAYADALRAQAKQLDKNVILAGARPKAELPKLLAGADGFVFPSLNESFGRAVLEALARGLPVIANDLPTLREIDSPAIHFYEFDQIDALEAKLREMMDKCSQWRAEACAGIDRIRQRHGLDEMVRATEQALLELVETGDGHGTI